MTVREIRPPGQDEVVAMLEHALVEAKAGIVRSVMVAAIRHDGSFTAGWMGPNTFFEKIGALEQLKHEMMRDGERDS